jgi:predicted peptidase
MIVLAAAARGQTPTAGASPGNGVQKVDVLGPGIHDATMRTPDGRTVRYSISIPQGSSSHVPLILALHFAGGPGSGRAVLEYLIRPAFSDLGAIIVAPDSVEGDWSTPGNQRAVNALLDAIISSYGVDARKIAVTGYSMGGAGTWYWADKYPERFSAAIPVAGYPSGSAASWRVPVFAVHSTADEVMPILPTQQRIDELRKMGKNAQLVTVSNVTHFQTDRHVAALRRAVPWLQDLWK